MVERTKQRLFVFATTQIAQTPIISRGAFPTIVKHKARARPPWQLLVYLNEFTTIRIYHVQKRNSDPKNTVDLTNSDTDSAKKTKATGSEQGSYEKDRVRVFLPAWKNNREWLKYIEEEKIMVCSLCKKYKKTESDFVNWK